MELCEFKASLVYRASSRTARTTQRNPVLEKKIKMSGLAYKEFVEDWSRPFWILEAPLKSQVLF